MKISRKITARIAPAGNVMIQDITIVCTDFRLMELTPSTKPIPITAPTKV